MKSFIYSGLIIISCFSRIGIANTVNDIETTYSTETRLENGKTIHWQEGVQCPEVLTIPRHTKKDTKWEDKLAETLAPDLPLEFRDTLKLESNNIKAGIDYHLREGVIGYKDGQIISLTCDYSIAEKPSRIFITIKQRPDYQEGDSKPYLPYSVIGTRTIEPTSQDNDYTTKKNCGFSHADLPLCGISPMFLIVVNTTEYQTLYRSASTYGDALIVETTGKKRQVTTKPVLLKDRNKSGKRSYIPYKQEVTAFKIKLDTDKELKDLTKSCLPDGMNIDRIPVSSGASMVLKIGGEVTEEGKNKGTKCSITCSTNSDNPSCWKRKTDYNYTCNKLLTAADYLKVSDSINYLFDLFGWKPYFKQCWTLAQQKKPSRLYQLVIKSTQDDPYDLLEIDPGKYHSQFSIKDVVSRFRIHPDKCESEFTDLCLQIYQKITKAKEYLQSEKNYSESKPDTGEEQKKAKQNGYINDDGDFERIEF